MPDYLKYMENYAKRVNIFHKKLRRRVLNATQVSKQTIARIAKGVKARSCRYANFYSQRRGESRPKDFRSHRTNTMRK
jgi:hypothetical protein